MQVLPGNQEPTTEPVKKEEKEITIVEEKKEPERARSGTWGSETVRKEKVVVRKVQTLKDKDPKKIGDDRRQKRGE